MALAHLVGDKVEAAYRRGDLLEKRRRLMEEWARYCGRAPVNVVASVTALRGSRPPQNFCIDLSNYPHAYI